MTIRFVSSSTGLWSHHFMANRWENSGNSDRLYILTLAGAWGQRKMSALLEQKEQQERLREAAALGDIREVQKLVESGVDVNSKNEVNGW